MGKGEKTFGIRNEFFAEMLWWLVMVIAVIYLNTRWVTASVLIFMLILITGLGTMLKYQEEKLEEMQKCLNKKK